MGRSSKIPYWINAAVKELQAIESDHLYLIAKEISDFNAKNSVEITDEEIQRVVSAAMRYQFILPHALHAGQTIFRARPCNPGEIFKNTTELSYPQTPPSRPGRANKPGAVLFYAGSSFETVMSELGVSNGDFYNVVEARIKQGSNIKVGMIGDFDSVRRYGKTVLNKKAYKQYIHHIVSQLKGEVQLAVWLVDAFFADRFSRAGEYEYKVTSAITNEYLSINGLDGIAYPSIKLPGNVCYAIRPEAVDNKIEFVKCSAEFVLNDFGYGVFRGGTYAEAVITKHPCDIPWKTDPNKIKKVILEAAIAKKSGGHMLTNDSLNKKYSK